MDEKDIGLRVGRDRLQDVCRKMPEIDTVATYFEKIIEKL